MFGARLLNCSFMKLVIPALMPLRDIISVAPMTTINIVRADLMRLSFSDPKENFKTSDKFKGMLL